MKFSVFARATSAKPCNSLTVNEFVSIVHDPAKGGYRFLQARNLVDKIRAITCESTQKRLKLSLPAISPGALFGNSRQDIVSYTGMMQLDFDKVENPEIIRDQVAKLPWIFLAALSVRRGIWILVRIGQPQYQALYWELLNTWFIKKFGISADPARKNPNDLRFFSPDPQAKFNPGACFLPALPPIRKVGIPQPYIAKKVLPNGSNLSPIDDFNQRGDVISHLLDQGWKIDHRKGNNIRLTRPGKRNGISADWSESLRRLYVFTNNSPLNQVDPSHALSPTDVFMQIHQIKSLKEARLKLGSLGYGSPTTYK